MPSTSYIHFETSERRILLKVVDVLSILLGLYVVSSVFDFEYFTLAANNWEWIFVLVVYFVFFAHIFELYDLQKSSKYDLIFPNILMVCFFTVLLYLLTPFSHPYFRITDYKLFIFSLRLPSRFCFGGGDIHFS